MREIVHGVGHSPHVSDYSEFPKEIRVEVFCQEVFGAWAAFLGVTFENADR